MPAEEFRRAGHEVVDWIADYLATIRELPVLPDLQPGELSAKLPASAPEIGESIEQILADFRRLIVPATTHWNHPRFHAYFSASASGPGILGEMLTAALNVNGMVWKSSPAATELEQVTLGWLREWLGLPDDFFGIIYDTASTSTMHALACAREAADPEARRRGGSRHLTVYCSEHAHSSVEKGAIAVGLGRENVRKIACDDEFRMDARELEHALQRDLKADKQPCAIVATVGTTSTTSIDPVAAAAVLAERHNAWLHVDAAYGGAAAVAPELQHILEGCESAHSLVMNPHKWLFTPMDMSVLYTRRPEVLKRTFSLVPEFLKTAQDSTAVNLMDYGVPLGRRFRSLKLWFVMRYFGRQGIAAVIRNHVAWSQELAGQIRRHPRFELAAPVPLSLVCFRLRGSDEENRRLMDAINASGVAFLSHTVLNERFVLRMSMDNIKLTRDDVQMVWAKLQSLVQ